MRVLVTGGAGYIGSRLTSHLLESGMDIVVFDKLIYGGEGLLSLLDHPRFSLIVGDIRDEKALRKALGGIEAVVHMAAIVGEPACKIDPDASLSTNYEASGLIAHLARESGVKRFIFPSTCSNYGVSDPNSLADETTTLNPLSLYAESKIRAEKAVLQIKDKGFAPCVLRLGTVCGLSPRMRFNLLLNEMARAAVLGDKISIFSPNAWRPFLHIRDAVEVILHCLKSPPKSIRGAVFNVISENYQKRKLVGLVQKYFPHIAVEVTDSSEDPRDYRVKADLIKEALGFRPGHTVEEAFLSMVSAVRCGVFSDPHCRIYEKLPEASELNVEKPQKENIK